MGTQFTEFDVPGANLLLDQAGLTRGADGQRRLADGRPLRIRLLVPALGNTEWPAVLERVERDWRNVGVEMHWETLPREEFYQLVSENRHDGVIWWGGGGHSPALEPEYYVPVTFERLGPLRVFYAVPWARWFLDSAAPGAELPPDHVREQMELFRRVMAEPDVKSRNLLVARIIDQAAKEFYAIGICLENVTLVPRNPAFRNVPNSHFDSWLYPDPGPLNPSQFFLETTTVRE